MREGFRWIIFIFIFGIVPIIISCNRALIQQLTETEETSFPVYRLSPQPQLTGGDPEKGFQYLITGNYMTTGFPYGFFTSTYRSGTKDRDTSVLDRDGINSGIPYTHTAFVSPEGAKVVNGNCFSCHASVFNGEVVLGLGNSFGDFTGKLMFGMKAANTIISAKYDEESPERKSYDPVRPIYNELAKKIKSPNVGLNPAAYIAEISGLLRNPADLSVIDEPFDTLDFGGINIATDVPALWNMKKKHALYYNGLGQGDFTKLLMQITLSGITDTTHAREVQKNFVDVLAWLEQLEPPKYPYPVDPELVAQGKNLFEENCKKCHGTYGKRPYYPNKIVPLHEIKTDPTYARATLESDLVTWYNQSWYATSPPQSEHKPSEGYIAPPLDGVWCTAPYLHNGSVPTLEDLLNSKQRPEYWQRSGKSDDYDFEKVGWKYQRKSNGTGKLTYNTHKLSSGNEGHYFGDEFSEAERKAVIEYLKTL